MNIKTLTKSLFYSAFLWFSVAEVSAQKTQKIGDNPYSIDSKAVLELESTTKGFLPPRMTTAQMNAITSPTEGMIVYCTDCGVNTDGELRIAYNSVWQTFKGDLTGNVTGTSANVTGVVAAANGGTGAATLTGYVKGNGTSTMTASATIPVADVSGAAPLASPTFTGTVTGVTSTMVGLGNVNNTSDASKPVSTATQTALDLKAPLASPTFTGAPLAPTAAANTNNTQIATTAFVQTAIGTIATGPFATASNVTSNSGGTLASDDFVFGSTSLNNITGTTDDSRMFFDKSKSAFRAGSVNSTQWDVTNIGEHSTAFGYGTTASASGSIAMGSGTTASGDYSIAMGSGITASGHYSIAMGSGTRASGGRSTAMGYGTTASGDFSTAMGVNTTAKDYGSVVIGQYNSAGSSVSTGGSATAFDTDNTAFVIGKGSAAGSRSDAFSVLFNGNTTAAGTITAGTVTYPNTHNTTAGQVLTTDASGVASWSTPSTTPDATTSAKGIVKLAGDLAGTADVPTIASNAVTTAKILNANVTDAKLATGIDAAKLADGTVSNAELQYINSLTSNAQTQISTNATDITALETLADGKIYLGNGSNVATEVTMSGDVTMSNAGAATIGASKVVSSMIADGTIVDADISSSAAIAQSKVSNLTTDLAAKAPLASPTFTGTVTAPTLVAGTNTFPTNRGTANQVLTTDGSGTLAWSAPVVIEVFDEFSVGTTGNTAFTLTATPGASSIVKMYVNGVLISKTGYTLSGTALTYVPANNVNYALTAGDRVQFIYTR